MSGRHLFLAGLLLLMSMAPLLADDAGEVTLVLVSGSDLGGGQLTPNQLRRAFFGIPLRLNGHDIRALRNGSDPLLNEIFLQKVVYMSARRYERQLVSLTFRTGRARPPRFARRDDLVQALKTLDDSIAVMWKRNVGQDSGLHIIQTLWKGHPQ
ncbi:MAG TPA: hypothetical protein ENJ79_06960 [Gammaproteobacteria bacterium]|nr:hypothetical protein [Gammaproteobacteria bacterium]